MSYMKTFARLVIIMSATAAGILVTGARSALHAQDQASCILGGPGVLCYTKQVQVCREWKLSGFTVGTSFTMSITCGQWETVTQYFYKESGSGGATTPKKLT